MSKKTLYLVLAIAGGVIPYYFFISHFADRGLSLRDFTMAVVATDAASGFAAALLISSLVFWIAIFSRRKAGHGPAPLPFILLNLVIGLSCALPAYFYANEKQRARRA